MDIDISDLFGNEDEEEELQCNIAPDHAIELTERNESSMSFQDIMQEHLESPQLGDEETERVAAHGLHPPKILRNTLNTLANPALFCTMQTAHSESIVPIPVDFSGLYMRDTSCVVSKQLQTTGARIVMVIRVRGVGTYWSDNLLNYEVFGTCAALLLFSPQTNIDLKKQVGEFVFDGIALNAGMKPLYPLLNVCDGSSHPISVLGLHLLEFTKSHINGLKSGHHAVISITSFPEYFSTGTAMYNAFVKNRFGKMTEEEIKNELDKPHPTSISMDRSSPFFLCDWTQEERVITMLVSIGVALLVEPWNYFGYNIPPELQILKNHVNDRWVQRLELMEHVFAEGRWGDLIVEETKSRYIKTRASIVPYYYSPWKKEVGATIRGTARARDNYIRDICSVVEMREAMIDAFDQKNIVEVVNIFTRF